MGRYGSGTNANGQSLVDFCLSNVHIIDDTILPHKDILKLTSKSADVHIINQTDHVLINGK